MTSGLPTTLPGGRPSYRVVLLGDQGVGKSSISHRFIKDDFLENNPPTIGAAYLTQSLNVGEQTVKLDIWDTAGQERFAPLAPMYYRTAEAAVVVYDICTKDSYTRGLEWVREVQSLAPGNIVIILCGNKVDLAVERRQVKAEEAVADAKDMGLMFTEVSAKTGIGVKEVFEAIAQKLANRSPRVLIRPHSSEANIKLSRRDSERKSCPCSS